MNVVTGSSEQGHERSDRPGMARLEEQEELFNFTASSTGRAERLWEVLQHALRES